MPHISKRFSQISESKTVALNSVMAKMKREGKDVVGLGAGEPDFDTPDHIKKAAINAIEQGFTKYTPADGMFDLKTAIADWLLAERSIQYEPKQIVVTCGAKHAVYESIAAVCDPGDEVILPAPYWVSYPEQIKLAQAEIKAVKTGPDNGLKITAKQLEKTISSKTRLLILNSPGNPSGAVYTKEELADIADVIAESGVYVLSDEIYDQIVFDDMEYASMADFHQQLGDQLIYINGVSKSFAMTGWRIGFLAAHADIATAIKKYQGHSTSNPSSISQKAAYAGYVEDKQFVKEMRKAFQERRDFVHDRLNAMPNVSCMLPKGAFYAFPDFSAYYGGSITSSLEFCAYLLEEHRAAIVPGVAFGMDAHARLSVATSMQNLEKALERIETGLKALA
ncbi:MAG: pyridoxal phosphate-dependent aminotransferase [candidate division KSB1 bacterium]|nr:pyridoxal phosphate-dependent aminotransferase [candidate division KSB1 bacterium]